MTTLDKVRVIAEYDGWELVSETIEGRQLYCANKPIVGRLKYEFSDEMYYLTSLDWLHPCAMKVMDELRQTKAVHRQFYIADIYENCSEKPINSEYIDLFNAVYEGIIFLNSQKEKV